MGGGADQRQVGVAIAEEDVEPAVKEEEGAYSAREKLLMSLNTRAARAGGMVTSGSSSDGGVM